MSDVVTCAETDSALSLHDLLLDGHGSQVFNRSFLQLMKENDIHPICFPPHTAQWLQQADKTFLKSLKHGWMAAGRDRECSKVTRHEAVFELFVPSWTKAASVKTAQSSFRETGMFPVNKNAHPKHTYEPNENPESPSQVSYLLTISATNLNIL